ncbi:hypothetical protein ACJJTC_011851 [Scirpophaga incertulas]
MFQYDHITLFSFSDVHLNGVISMVELYRLRAQVVPCCVQRGLDGGGQLVRVVLVQHAAALVARALQQSGGAVLCAARPRRRGPACAGSTGAARGSARGARTAAVSTRQRSWRAHCSSQVVPCCVQRGLDGGGQLVRVVLVQHAAALVARALQQSGGAVLCAARPRRRGPACAGSTGAARGSARGARTAAVSTRQRSWRAHCSSQVVPCCVQRGLDGGGQLVRVVLVQHAAALVARALQQSGGAVLCAARPRRRGPACAGSTGAARGSARGARTAAVSTRQRSWRAHCSSQVVPCCVQRGLDGGGQLVRVVLVQHAAALVARVLQQSGGAVLCAARPRRRGPACAGSTGAARGSARGARTAAVSTRQRSWRAHCSSQVVPCCVQRGLDGGGQLVRVVLVQHAAALVARVLQQSGGAVLCAARPRRRGPACAGSTGAARGSARGARTAAVSTRQRSWRAHCSSQVVPCCVQRGLDGGGQLVRVVLVQHAAALVARALQQSGGAVLCAARPRRRGPACAGSTGAARGSARGARTAAVSTRQRSWRAYCSSQVVPCCVQRGLDGGGQLVRVVLVQHAAALVARALQQSGGAVLCAARPRRRGPACAGSTGAARGSARGARTAAVSTRQRSWRAHCSSQVVPCCVQRGLDGGGQLVRVVLVQHAAALVARALQQSGGAVLCAARPRRRGPACAGSTGAARGSARGARTAAVRWCRAVCSAA